MPKETGLAERLVAEYRREVPVVSGGSLTPYGAKIEMASRLMAARDGRAAALRYLGDELVQAKDTSLRAHISKNINLMLLEGTKALPIGTGEVIGARPPALESLKGKPVLLFLWAHWCDECRAHGEFLGRLWKKYRDKGLSLIAPTRYYGTVAEKNATPIEEREQIARVWKESYDDLEEVPVVIDLDTMVRYGVSATPTFVLIDRKGLVRLYSPAGLSEPDLSTRIDQVLGE